MRLGCLAWLQQSVWSWDAKLCILQHVVKVVCPYEPAGCAGQVEPWLLCSWQQCIGSVTWRLACMLLRRMPLKIYLYGMWAVGVHVAIASYGTVRCALHGA